MDGTAALGIIIVIIVSAFVIMLLVIIIVVLICVIKFRAAKTKRPPDGGCTENSEGKTILYW